jgi:hypothetical protein
MKTLLSIALASCVTVAVAQPKPIKPNTQVALSNNFEKDKACIKSMCGVYKVSFDFAETFSADTGYKYHERYSEWGIEYVFAVEETPTKIALQHLLIVNDTMIIKHWRQDWTYENTNLYSYYKDNEWTATTITPAQAKGTWTQKVFQVDDSPRYESYGTWIHVDGKDYWEGLADAPLPRREFTKRSDYNIMRRHSRMDIYNDSWALLQDNEKISRTNGMDKVLCWEKGVEKFTKGNYDATPAIKYWDVQKNYWADVRQVWADVFAATPNLKLLPKVDGKRLYESLFELGEKTCVNKQYKKGIAKDDIKKIITAFVKPV